MPAGAHGAWNSSSMRLQRLPAERMVQSSITAPSKLRLQSVAVDRCNVGHWDWRPACKAPGPCVGNRRAQVKSEWDLFRDNIDVLAVRTTGSRTCGVPNM